MKRSLTISLLGSALGLTALPAMAQTACADLSSATFEGFAVTATNAVAAADTAPAHCEVLGQIPPQDPAGWPINFRVVLPEEWSGHAVQFGGGGFNGTIPAQAGGRWQTPQAAAEFPFKGHATFSGDSGHSVDDLPFGPDLDPRRASFALNEEAFARYARHSVGETFDAARQVIAAHYGADPEKQFFVGFSQGGKEAMIAAQDHGDRYDGILVGDPVSNLTGLKLAHLQSASGFYADGGAGWIGPDLAALVNDAVYAQCDPMDGLEDGWIADFESCNPDLTALLCSADQSDACLSQAQLDALNNIARPVELDYEIANGLTGHAGYPWGNVAWQGSFAGERAQPSQPAPSQGGNDSYVWTLGDGYARFMIAQDAQLDTLAFDPNDPQWRDRIIAVSQILDATNPDLSVLRDNGAKMILYAGGTSEVPPAEVAAYWTRMTETTAGAEDFARFYMFPSINHGGVGPEGMPNRSDLFSVLEAWVAGGEAPDVLVNSNDAGDVARPLCRYPAYPHYDAGDQNDAASFTCVVRAD